MLQYLTYNREQHIKGMDMTEEEFVANEEDEPEPKMLIYGCIPRKYPSIAKVKDQLTKLNNAIEKEEKEFEVGSKVDKFVGTAFVTLNNQMDVENVINEFNIHFLSLIHI